MFKKLIIIAVVAMVGSVVFMPEITASMARTALSEKHVHKEWAPKMAYSAAKINLRMFRYKTSAAILERSIKAWPKAEWQGDAHFQHAISYEKMEQGETAIGMYKDFLAKYPDHKWKEQANKPISNIEATLLCASRFRTRRR